jgi:hypothetical protein
MPHKCCECGADTVRAASEALGQVRCAECYAHYHYKREERFHRGVIVALLALALLSFVAAACGSEDVPAWVLSGIAAEETGSVYRDGALVIYRNRADGDAGEVSAWQLAPVVLAQWHASQSRARSNQRYALRLVRQHLLWLRAHCASWDEAVRAYHRGLAGRNRPSAFAYARRVAAASL